MAKPELLQSITSLTGKIDSLIALQQRLLKRIEELETENRHLQNKSLEDRQALNQALRDVEFLSMSHKLAASPEAIIEAREKISSLIRTIDKCIRMINED